MKALVVVLLGLLCWAEASHFEDLLINRTIPERHPCDENPEMCSTEEVCVLDEEGRAFCAPLEGAIERPHFSRICRHQHVHGRIARECRCRSSCCDRGNESEYVCGSDDCSYPTACHLHQRACAIGKRVFLVRRGRCNESKESRSECPSYARIAVPPPPKVTVSLNASDVILWVIQFTPDFPSWIDWNIVNRFIAAYENSRAKPDDGYARIIHSLEVLDALCVIHFEKKFPHADYVAKTRVYSLKSLPTDSPFIKSFAIADALFCLFDYDMLTLSQKELASFRDQIFNAPISLQCAVQNADKIIWYHEGTEIRDDGNHQILTDCLLLRRVRPIDEGKYTCEAKGPHSSTAKATTSLEVKAEYLSSPLPSYISPPAPCTLNHTVWSGQYSCLRFSGYNALNMTFVNFSSPYLELTNFTLTNLTFVNTTIDTLVLSDISAVNVSYINVTLRNATHANGLIFNQTIINSTLTNASYTNFTSVNGSVNNTVWVNLQTNVTTFTSQTMTNVTIIDSSYLNTCFVNGVEFNSTLRNSDIVNSCFFNYTKVNYTVSNSRLKSSSLINFNGIKGTHLNMTYTNFSMLNAKSVNAAECQRRLLPCS